MNVINNKVYKQNKNIIGNRFVNFSEIDEVWLKIDQIAISSILTNHKLYNFKLKFKIKILANNGRCPNKPRLQNFKNENIFFFYPRCIYLTQKYVHK